jgi:hypothetical protein
LLLSLPGYANQKIAIEALAVTLPCPTRQEFYRAACQVLELDEPVFAPPSGQPPAQYDISRLRRDLLSQPVYPDWRAALIME